MPANPFAYSLLYLYTRTSNNKMDGVCGSLLYYILCVYIYLLLYTYIIYKGETPRRRHWRRDKVLAYSNFHRKRPYYILRTSILRGFFFISSRTTTLFFQLSSSVHPTFGILQRVQNVYMCARVRARYDVCCISDLKQRFFPAFFARPPPPPGDVCRYTQIHVPRDFIARGRHV